MPYITLLRRLTYTTCQGLDSVQHQHQRMPMRIGIEEYVCASMQGRSVLACTDDWKN